MTSKLFLATGGKYIAVEPPNLERPGIVYITHGDYRHMTTRMWWIVKQTYPRSIHLYEPLHPNIFKYMEQYPKGSIFPLHGLPVMDDYHDLPKEVLDKMRKKHRDWTNVFEPEEVIEYLEVVDEWAKSNGKRVFLQPNRMGFILGDVAKHFDAQCVHLIRNPADVFADYFPREWFSSDDKIWKVIRGQAPESVYAGAFYLPVRYPAISKKFGIEAKPDDWFSKFVVVWVMANYHAVMSMIKNDVGTVVAVEHLCTSPQLTATRLYYSTGLRIRPDLLEQLDIKRLRMAPKWLEELFIERVEIMGLKNYLRGWYPYRLV